MPKLSPYKFINPGSSGKSSPAIRAARKGVLAKNRLGSVVTGLGLVVGDMRDIAWANVKLDVMEKKLLNQEKYLMKRKLQLYLKIIYQLLRLNLFLLVKQEEVFVRNVMVGI